MLYTNGANPPNGAVHFGLWEPYDHIARFIPQPTSVRNVLCTAHLFITYFAPLFASWRNLKNGSVVDMLALSATALSGSHNSTNSQTSGDPNRHTLKHIRRRWVSTICFCQVKFCQTIATTSYNSKRQIRNKNDRIIEL